MVNKIQKYKMDKVEAKNNIAADVKVKEEPIQSDLNQNEVVEEYRVFISQDIANLLLLKHTHLPPHHRFCHSESEESSKYIRLGAKYKPKHNAFQYFQQVDTKVNCDEVKAEEIAEDVGDKFFESRTQDKDIYTSSYIEPPPGVIMMSGHVSSENNITLTPITKQLQMNISLDHLDEAAKQKSEKDKEKMRAEGKISKMPSINHIKETEAQREAREKSFHTYLENLKAEKWQNLEFFEEDTLKSDEERQKLDYYFDKERFEEIDNTDSIEMTAQEYLLKLHPKIDRKDVVKPNSNESHSTKQDLNKILNQIFIRAQVVNFSTLKEICQERKLETNLFEKVKEYADVLHGRLVVKSSVLYNDKYKSPFIGMEMSKLMHVRNYILCSFYFSNDKTLFRSKLYKDLQKIDRRELDAVINSIAEFDDKVYENGEKRLKLKLTDEGLDQSPQEIETAKQIWTNMLHSAKKSLDIAS